MGTCARRALDASTAKSNVHQRDFWLSVCLLGPGVKVPCLTAHTQACTYIQMHMGMVMWRPFIEHVSSSAKHSALPVT